MELKNLRISNFRGICGLNLEVQPRGLVLWGMNGDGKSSVVDALEWVLWGEVRRLKQFEFGRLADLLYCRCPPGTPASVTAAFAGSPPVTRSMAMGKTASVTGEVPTGLRGLPPQTLILRRDDLAEFVRLTKQQKLDAVERLFGIEALSEARAEIQAAATGLASDRDYANAAARRDDAAATLEEICGVAGPSAAAVLSVAERLRAEASLPNPIASTAALVAAAGAPPIPPPQAGELQVLQNIVERADTAHRAIPDIGQLGQLQRTHAQLLSQKDKLEARAFRGLYAAALSLFSQGRLVAYQCPLCGQSVPDLARLAAQWTSTVQQLDSLLASWTPWQQTANNLRASTELLEPSLAKLVAADVRDHELIAPLVQQIQAARARARSLAQSLAGVQHDPESVTSDGLAPDCLGPLQALLAGLSNTGKERRDAASHSAAARQWRAHQSLARLARAWNDHQHFAALAGRFEAQIRGLREILARLEAFEEQLLSSTLTRLSRSVNEFFSALHPKDGVLDIRLVHTDERGAEFTVNFHGQDVLDPRRVVSEGHLHSLGLCLFLANAAAAAGECRLLVLDDVATSLDANHRAALARLLKSHFGDWQLIVLTHDDILKEHVRRELNLPVKLFSPWQVDEGAVLFEDPGPAKTRMEAALKKGLVEEAGPCLRQWLEAELKVVAHALQARLPFVPGPDNDERLLGDLVDAVQAALKELKPGGVLKDTFHSFASVTWVANAVSHDRGGQASPPSPGDLEEVVERFQAFLDALQCPNCHHRPHFKHSEKGLGPAQCKCGPMSAVTFGP